MLNRLRLKLLRPHICVCVLCVYLCVWLCCVCARTGGDLLPMLVLTSALSNKLCLAHHEDCISIRALIDFCRSGLGMVGGEAT